MGSMSLKNEIENIRIEDGAKGLALMARKLGYRSAFAQLAFGNGATASDLFDFFEDNPGAVEAVINWVVDRNQDVDGQPLDEEDDEEEDDEEVFDGDIEEANRYTVGD